MVWYDNQGNRVLETEDMSAYNSHYYKRNKGRIDEMHREWVSNNPEKVNEYHAKYREANREKRNEYDRQYRARKKAEKEAKRNGEIKKGDIKTQ